MCYKGENNVRDSFRRTMDEALYNFRFSEYDASTCLRTTLFRMAELRLEESNNNGSIILFKVSAQQLPTLPSQLQIE